jgi:hypothetical protein
MRPADVRLIPPGLDGSSSIPPSDQLNALSRGGAVTAGPFELRHLCFNIQRWQSSAQGTLGRPSGRQKARPPSISPEARFVHLECPAAHDRDSGHQLRRPLRHTVTTPLNQEP